MKYCIFFCLVSVLLFSSCNDYNPVPPYVYESNPHYSLGYADFYGSYYADYGNQNNTFSLSFFSDSLKITEEGGLTGYGQYLFLEDVFVAPTDTVLPAGTYMINNTGMPFTAFAGANDTVNGDIYHSGAYINYYEKTAAKSTVKLIASGLFTVAVKNAVYTIHFNFKTADKQVLLGTYIAELPHYNQLPEIEKLKVRKDPLSMTE